MMISRRIGRYEIDRLLGEGGVGRVYAAHDTLLGRRVAIKTLRPEASRNRDFIERFLNEAKSFGDLRHPNITGLYDLDLAGQPPHMVMELVEGHTLEELLEWGALPPRECLAVVAQVTAGLSVAHQKGVIHRDIKPSNLMITETGLLKIMDFGIARVRGSQRLTRADQVFATLLYASPEQLRGGEVDERSDVYSLAAVAYEILAGRPPFSADNDADLRSAQLELPPPPLAPLAPGLPPRIEAAILRGLAKRPEGRFANVENFAEAIGAADIRREAADILQGYFTPLLRRVSETHQTRLFGLSQDFSNSQNWTGSGSAAATAQRPSLFALLRRSGLGSGSMRWPIAALGAAILALFAALGYAVVSWPSGPLSPPNQPQTARGAISTSTPNLPNRSERTAAIEAQPSITPLRRPESTPPVSSEKSEAVSATPTESVSPAPKAALAQPSAVKAEPKPMAAVPAELPAPTPAPKPVDEPKTSPAAPPPTKPNPDTKIALARPPAAPPNPSRLDPSMLRSAPPQHSYPEGEPQLQGVVTNFGSAEWIFVDRQKVQLYGIRDIARTPAELIRHQRVMASYIHRGETYAVCYQRPEHTYRCYAGDENLADMALSVHIARSLGGTP